jgi:dienelactone hydrolase
MEAWGQRWRCPGRWTALLAVLLGAVLAGCATQPPTDVRVNVGSGTAADFKAVDYAALYAPYAMMATAAYAEPADFNRSNCPDPALLARPAADGSDAEYRASVRGWIARLHAGGWQCDFGVHGNLPCPPRAGGSVECKPVGGLQFHVWRRMQGGRCREAVIAFRGTDKNDRGDWISNFRWLYRLAPKFDQYAQVQAHIKQVVARIKKNGCGGAGTQFVSVGHSLGGGLAQQAAYADESNSIRYVYAFDPSPVTGFFDVSAVVLKQSTDGLGVDRAYEAGEILALPRTIIENIYPPAACRPRVRTVRFNLLTGFGIAQHNIEGLTKKLIVTAKTPGANPRRVNDALRARACKGAPMLLMVPPA